MFHGCCRVVKVQYDVFWGIFRGRALSGADCLWHGTPLAVFSIGACERKKAPGARNCRKTAGPIPPKGIVLAHTRSRNTPELRPFPVDAKKPRNDGRGSRLRIEVFLGTFWNHARKWEWRQAMRISQQQSVLSCHNRNVHIIFLATNHTY